MADSTISGLTAATALQAADLAAVVQSGTTKKATLAQIQANSLPLAGGTMTGALVADAGTALLPGAAVGATTVGHYSGGTGATEFLGITANATSMARVTTAGVRIQSGAAGAASSLFHVSATGNANALRVDDTNGTVGIAGAPLSSALLTVNGSSGTTCYSATNLVASTWAYRVSHGGQSGIFISSVSRAQIYLRDSSGTTDVFITGGAHSYINSTQGLVLGSATEDTTSILTLASTTRGFLPPRMTTTQRDAIGSPATGLIAYNTTTNKVNVYTGSAWEAVTSA
jgi:hypothetical protein